MSDKNYSDFFLNVVKLIDGIGLGSYGSRFRRNYECIRFKNVKVAVGLYGEKVIAKVFSRRELSRVFEFSFYDNSWNFSKELIELRKAVKGMNEVYNSEDIEY